MFSVALLLLLTREISGWANDDAHFGPCARHQVRTWFGCAYPDGNTGYRYQRRHSKEYHNTFNYYRTSKPKATHKPKTPHNNKNDDLCCVKYDKTFFPIEDNKAVLGRRKRDNLEEAPSGRELFVIEDTRKVPSEDECCAVCAVAKAFYPPTDLCANPCRFCGVKRRKREGDAPSFLCPSFCHVDCSGCLFGDGVKPVADGKRRRKRCEIGTCGGGRCDEACYEPFDRRDALFALLKQPAPTRRKRDVKDLDNTRLSFAEIFHLPLACSPGGLGCGSSRRRKRLAAGVVEWPCEHDLDCNVLWDVLEVPTKPLRARCIRGVCQDVLSCVGAQFDAKEKDCHLIATRLDQHDRGILPERLRLKAKGDLFSKTRRKRCASSDCIQTPTKAQLRFLSVLQKAKGGDCGFRGCCRYAGFRLKKGLVGEKLKVLHQRECCAICKANKKCRSAEFKPKEDKGTGTFVCDKFLCPGTCELSTVGDPASVSGLGKDGSGEPLAKATVFVAGPRCSAPKGGFGSVDQPPPDGTAQPSNPTPLCATG